MGCVDSDVDFLIDIVAPGGSRVMHDANAAIWHRGQRSSVVPPCQYPMASRSNRTITRLKGSPLKTSTRFIALCAP